MTYIPKRKVFSLTQTKMEHWHRYTRHNFDKSNCVFCQGDMEKVAKFLKTQGFKIVKIGTRFVEIQAKINPRHEEYGPTTDEVDELFNLVSGRIEGILERLENGSLVLTTEHGDTFRIVGYGVQFIDNNSVVPVGNIKPEHLGKRVIASCD